MQAFFRFFAKLIVTHIFSDVPQLIQHFSDFTSKTLCCLAFITFSLFSFQGTNALISFETRSQNTIPCVLRSNLNSCLVGPSGLEPPTLRLSVVRSSQLSYGPVPGGDSRDRTGDLLLARQALSQLSYIPSYLSGLYPLN